MGEQVITMPVVVLRRLTIFPGMVLHFDISRLRSITAIGRAMVGDQKLSFVVRKHPEVVEPERGDSFQVGIVEVVKQLVKLPDKVVHVLVEGLERTEFLCLEAEKPAMMDEITTIEAKEDDLDSLAQEAMLRILEDRLEEHGRVNSKVTKGILPNLLIVTDLDEMLDQITIQLPWDYIIHQTVLENSSLSTRYEVTMHTLLIEVKIYKTKGNFQKKVKADIGQNQKEYILRERMKVTHQELGEGAVLDANEYQKKLDALKTDKEVKEKFHKEIERFRNMPIGSQEVNVLRVYMETLLDLPWKKMSKDNDDIKHAEKILNGSHCGLEQVRERVLEYLAVHTLAKKGTNSTIRLVRPPGTGKTSIARSAARALNKKYIRVSLGGVRDEAEIRGYGETYMGTMSGCIVEGMHQVSVSNSLMPLDEIGKVSNNHKGDTSSALLEVLDGEQNVKFRDHYMEPSIDLSQVLFIVTANTTQTIPGPLLDCIELIEANSCMEDEEFHIARDYLVSKQMEHNGLKDSQITFLDKSLEKIIHNYTREAGVRSPERRIGDVCRRVARQFLGDKRRSAKISESNLGKYLGKEKVTFENANKEDEIGIIRGLAWTSVGGDTPQIEVNVAPGKGSSLMTGQLGDMMKESAQITLTYVRSTCPEYGVANDYFERHDLYIHVPEDTMPKDGPSTGIAVATAMLPAVTGKSVQTKVTITGEIALRGQVLPIGGLKRRILVAKVAHMERVLVPDKNRPDMAELSKEITKGLDIAYIKTMENVVSEAFVQSADRNWEKQI